jgi:hypothetical protein
MVRLLLLLLQMPWMLMGRQQQQLVSRSSTNTSLS